MFLMLCCLWQPSLYAQEETKVSLSEVISTLQIRFGKTFNYLETNIEDVTLLAPHTDLSLEEALNYIASETGFTFKFLPNDFIVIQGPKEIILCGFLKNAVSLAPLAGGFVSSDSGSSITDAAGYFQIKVKSEKEKLSFKFLGYETLVVEVITISKKNCDDFNMQLVAETLSPVILSSYLVSGIDQMQDRSFAIDFSKFNTLPGLIETDVLQTVQAFPGIQSSNETVSNINIRGGTHDQNLILWDDIKMYQSGHFFGLISAFNPQITQKISLVKNGSRASYSNGVSGTIAMRTNDKLTKDTNGSLGANLTDVNGFLDTRIGRRSSMQIAVRKSINDWIKTPTYTTYFDRISQDTEVATNEEDVVNTDRQFDFYDTSLRWLSHLSERDKLRINFILVDNSLVFNENAELNEVPASKESSISQTSIAGGILYERAWSKNVSTTLQVYNTDYKLKAINANLLASQRFLQDNSVSETGASLITKSKYGNRIIGELGYQFTETKVTNLDDVDVPIFRSKISEVVRTHSLFSQWDLHSADDKTFVNAGVRYNFLDKFSKHIVEPRIAISYKLTPDVAIHAAGEMKHQVTSQVVNFQNDFLGIEKRRWQLSNDTTIPVIRSEQVSLGLSFEDNGWLIDTDGYLKKVKGITAQSQGFLNQYEFVKTDGSYEVLGVDVLFRKRLNKTSIWLSYGFMDNTYTFQSLPEKGFPSNLDITHTVSFGGAYTYKQFKVSGGLNWKTGNPSTAPVFGNEVVDETINYGPSNSVRLKEYLRADVSVLYQFKLGNSRLQMGASVWNVMNANNEVSNYYRVGETGQAQEFVQNSLGLTTNAMVRFFF